MGTDIYGWVEVWRQYPSGYACWWPVVNIENLVYRQYGMFGSLFGVRNGPGFQPLAAERGYPDDVSEDIKDTHLVHVTWILWSELATVDWDERGTRVMQYEEGSMIPTRGDVLNHGWAVLMKIMAALAEEFGAEHVRLTVGFDQD